MKILIVGSGKEDNETARMITRLMAENSIATTIIPPHEASQTTELPTKLTKNVIRDIAPPLNQHIRRRHIFKHRKGR